MRGEEKSPNTYVAAVVCSRCGSTDFAIEEFTDTCEVLCRNCDRYLGTVMVTPPQTPA